MAFVLAVCIALVCQSLVKAEQCEDCGTEFDRTYVLEGEPVFLDCPQCSLLSYEDNEVTYNFTWFKKDSNISITTDSLSRIYAVEKTVAFFPAKSEDAGFYTCVKRNSTNCWTKQVALVVYRNVEGFCYNPIAMFRQKLFEYTNDKIICPGLNEFPTSEQAQVTWLKECQPLKIDGHGIKPIGDTLQIENVTKADEGKYVCAISYYHKGEQFNVSRAIEMLTKVRERKQPVIIYPSDEKLYVKIGSSVQLTCNVSYTSDDFPDFTMSWLVNNSYADEYFNNSRMTLREAFSSDLADGTKVKTLILDIEAVERDLYGHKFVCFLDALTVRSEAYIILQPRAPDLVVPLIASFVALAFVIVIAVATYRVFKIDIVLCYRQSLYPIMNKKASDGKIYDAYVMFPKGSEYQQVCTVNLFVLKVLPEVLEKQCGYKLFIFGRDDLPGEAVADVLDEAVQRSRRLIMILTRKTSHENFLYNGLEQSIALHDSLLSNKTKTILIELEKIDYSDVPESVKYIKGKQGTIRWKGDFTGKTLSPNTRFWKRVRYRMPPPHHSSSGESSYIPEV
ncbi:interleukin-1 receptor type 1 isoform X1 [Pleurodeles waltl]|uniref:interleukin-1 receptor type 1 isoform X1 n=1 Tax=Pleurodeles waltl TaxID=8319 RepID=UPI003709990A